MNENMATTACLPKHIELAQAIDGIDHVTFELNQLILRINGEINPLDNAKTESTEPSLSDVLEGSASIINEKSQRALELVNQLNNLLF